MASRIGELLVEKLGEAGLLAIILRAITIPGGIPGRQTGITFATVGNPLCTAPTKCCPVGLFVKISAVSSRALLTCDNDSLTSFETRAAIYTGHKPKAAPVFKIKLAAP